jgi:hypothetical protein
MSMSYRLNGGPAVAMGVGPDGRRLVNPGDFNVDILVSDLLPGANTVQIDAVDGTFDLSSTVVTVNLQSGTTWPLPYSPDLFAADEVADFGQVVDGKWEVANGQLRTVDTDIGYDRLVAIGDDSWTDYEATFTMRVNSLANPTGPASGQPAAGFLLRWNGHNAVGPGHQPQRGYVPNGTSDPTPFGAYGLWRNSATGGGRLELRDHFSLIQDTDTGFDLTLGVTYEVRARVETHAGGASTYRFSVWPEGTPEPASWDVEFTAGTSNDEPASGSLVLLAHEADVDFGDIAVNPLAMSPLTAVIDAGRASPLAVAPPADDAGPTGGSSRTAGSLSPAIEATPLRRPDVAADQP